MSLTIEQIQKAITDDVSEKYGKIYGDIPFLIILKTGRYAVRSLDFKNGFVTIK